tara:strand:+ start:316 stop:1149 length:834 start_codon:yes stop_codon:yes gene_type:complete
MLNEKFNLKNKTALITGAAGLLGEEHALALLSSNCNLILTDIQFRKLKELKKFLLSQYSDSNIRIFELDVTSKSSILRLHEQLQKLGIDINILINNAALNPKVEKNHGNKSFTRFESFDLEDWNLELAVGLTGAFLCSQVFGSDMAKKRKGGCILNIASDLSVIAPDQRIYMKDKTDPENQAVKPVTYSVIKTGLVGLTKYLATYWIGSNIRCNSLSPGGIYTSQPDDFVIKLSNLIPLGRMAKKDEYRAAIQFLCSDASSYMNGHNLVIDGGRSIW